MRDRLCTKCMYMIYMRLQSAELPSSRPPTPPPRRACSQKDPARFVSHKGKTFEFSKIHVQFWVQESGRKIDAASLVIIRYPLCVGFPTKERPLWYTTKSRSVLLVVNVNFRKSLLLGGSCSSFCRYTYLYLYICVCIVNIGIDIHIYIYTYVCGTCSSSCRKIYVL